MRVVILIVFALFSASSARSADEKRPVKFGIGDSPPPLAVGEFLKGESFKAFQPGQVYVVEFWATWCRPCLQAMPQFNGLQKANPKVVFLWIDVWDKDPAAVKEFVKGMGDKMSFSVALDGACDDDGTGTMAKTWLPAFGGKGIPSTVIIDGTGKVAWMGAPNKMEEPLRAILAGKWDVAAAAAEFGLRRQVEQAVEEYNIRIQSALDGGPEMTAGVLADYIKTLARLQRELEAAATKKK